MVRHAVRPEIGAVGAKLLYPDRTIQHGGIVLGIGGVAGHSHLGVPDADPGLFLPHGDRPRGLGGDGRVPRHAGGRVRGGRRLRRGRPQGRLHDVDLCLKIRRAGYRIIWTPFAKLIHHESKSRGAEDTPEKQKRFEGEVLTMLDRWGPELRADPYYNINLSRNSATTASDGGTDSTDQTWCMHASVGELASRAGCDTSGHAARGGSGQGVPVDARRGRQSEMSANTTVTGLERDAQQAMGDHKVHPNEIAIGVVIGRASEYFDFFVFGIACVLVFPKVFFPFVDRSRVRSTPSRSSPWPSSPADRHRDLHGDRTGATAAASSSPRPCSCSVDRPGGELPAALRQHRHLGGLHPGRPAAAAGPCLGRCLGRLASLLAMNAPGSGAVGTR